MAAVVWMVAILGALAGAADASSPLSRDRAESNGGCAAADAIADESRDFGCPDYRPWLRHGDSIYLINTRCRGCDGDDRTLALPTFRYSIEADDWQPSSIDELVADVPGSVTSIHVHGNRIDHATAVARGWAVYHEWFRRAPETTRMVFVIYSWPSSRIQGQIRDVREKASRTTAESYYLAQTLSAIPGDVPVSLTGHSFGARIICGAAHLLAGGQLQGYRLPENRVRTNRNLRAVLMAAAMHNHWLSPGSCHGRAMSEMQRVLNLYNTCDPVLRFYGHIERCARPEALGRSGVVFCCGAESLAERVDQWNVAPCVGKEHSFIRYLCHPRIADLAAPYVLFEPIEQP